METHLGRLQDSLWTGKEMVGKCDDMFELIPTSRKFDIAFPSTELYSMYNMNFIIRCSEDCLIVQISYSGRIPYIGCQSLATCYPNIQPPSSSISLGTHRTSVRYLIPQKTGMCDLGANTMRQSELSILIQLQIRGRRWTRRMQVAK